MRALEIFRQQTIVRSQGWFQAGKQYRKKEMTTPQRIMITPTHPARGRGFPVWDLFWKSSFPTQNENDLTKAQGSDRELGRGGEEACLFHPHLPSSPTKYVCKHLKISSNYNLFLIWEKFPLTTTWKKVDWRMAVSLHSLTSETE